MADKSTEQVRSEFDDVVNMGAKELDDWLATDESKTVGQGDDDEESKGHFMGRWIVDIQRKKADDLTDEDLATMKKVHGYVERHLKQKPSKQDLETSKWRYSLMNWGHDPLK